MKANASVKPEIFRIAPGISTTKKEDPAHLCANSWCLIEGSGFNVRSLPNYPKNKLKASSQDSLFDLHAIDIFATPNKIDHILQHVQLPNSEKADEAENKDNKIPDWLVVNVQIPSYAPNNPIWGATKEDGEGYSLVVYFLIQPAVKEELQNPSDKSSNAIRLLRQFFESKDEGFDDYKRRFKAIPRLANPDEVNLGMSLRPLVSTYNGKPFMTGPRCHSFHRGPNYLEVDVDVHRFCFLARKAVNGLIDMLPTMVIDLAFVVEGTTDEELPEQVLGCCRFSKLNLSTAKAPQDYTPSASSATPSSPAAPAAE